MNIYSSIIYKATNKINGKSYVGFTSLSLNQRKAKHLQNSKSSDNVTDTKFYNAIRKYGWESFTWEILYESWDNQYCLNFAEKELIKTFNTFKEGYNMTLGGDGGDTSNSLKYLSAIPIRKEKMKGIHNHFFGKHHSEEAKQKNREKHLKENLSLETRQRMREGQLRYQAKKRSNVSSSNTYSG